MASRLYELKVHRNVRQNGKGTGQALFRWPLPAGGEIPNGWPQN